jgi:hypothetical protein
MANVAYGLEHEGVGEDFSKALRDYLNSLTSRST